MGEIRDPRALEPLVAALKDSSGIVRGQAASALGAIGDPRAVEPLVAALKGADESLRTTAAGALSRIGVATVEPLIAAMNDPDSGVRGSAARALGGINDPRAATALLTVLEKHDTAVIASDAPLFIKLCKPGSEDALIEALDRFGNKDMAQLFLNCGNSRLEQAARAWAGRNGYQVIRNIQLHRLQGVN